MPVLSIITVNYNDLPGLKKTFASVWAQAFTDFEFVVIDGGSTDGSKEFIEANAGRIHYWVSEKDKGIYDAMNKGIAVANGEYINFLNSGDCYTSPETLQRCRLPERAEDILYGDFNAVYKDKVTLRKYDFEINFFIMSGGTFCHNATFIRKKLFSSLGDYDLRYPIVSDWHFFMKAIFRYQCSLFYLNECIVDYDMYGFSSIKTEQLAAERQEVLRSEYAHELVMLEKYRLLESRYKRILARFPMKQLSWIKIKMSKFFR